MSVDLLRIDDRLVHGQVVEGWVKALHITRIVVASDVVEADDTQKALYHLAVPHGVELSCLKIVGAAQEWKAGHWEKDRVIILVSTPEEALRLLEEGAPVKSVNLGGLHFRTGRVQVVKGISLDEEDVQALKSLAAQGVLLEARALPLDDPYDIVHYLEHWHEQNDELREQPR